MIELSHSVLIDAPPDSVQATAQAVQRWPEWYPGIERVEPDSLFPEPGGRVTLSYRIGQVTGKLMMTLLEVVPGQYTFYVMEGLINGTQRWAYTPDGESVGLAVLFNYRLPPVRAYRGSYVRRVKNKNAENLRAALQNLKSLMETEPTDTDTAQKTGAALAWHP
jgi:hypothetical protein